MFFIKLKLIECIFVSGPILILCALSPGNFAKGFPLYFTTHVADGFLYRIIYKELEAKRSFQSKGETVVNNINEKYSLYINNKGVQKLVDFNDKKVDFEDLPFFTDEMENAIVKHYKTNIHKIEDNDILTKWLEN